MEQLRAPARKPRSLELLLENPEFNKEVLPSRSSNASKWKTDDTVIEPDPSVVYRKKRRDSNMSSQSMISLFSYTDYGSRRNSEQNVVNSQEWGIVSTFDQQNKGGIVNHEQSYSATNQKSLWGAIQENSKSITEETGPPAASKGWNTFVQKNMESLKKSGNENTRNTLDATASSITPKQLDSTTPENSFWDNKPNWSERKTFENSVPAAESNVRCFSRQLNGISSTQDVENLNNIPYPDTAKDQKNKPIDTKNVTSLKRPTLAKDSFQNKPLKSSFIFEHQNAMEDYESCIKTDLSPEEGFGEDYINIFNTPTKDLAPEIPSDCKKSGVIIEPPVDSEEDKKKQPTDDILQEPLTSSLGNSPTIKKKVSNQIQATAVQVNDNLDVVDVIDFNDICGNVKTSNSKISFKELKQEEKKLIHICKVEIAQNVFKDVPIYKDTNIIQIADDLEEECDVQMSNIFKARLVIALTKATVINVYNVKKIDLL